MAPLRCPLDCVHVIDLASDIPVVDDVPAGLRRLYEAAQKDNAPVALTVNGKAAAVVQDAKAYQRLLDFAAGADSDGGIRQGLDDVVHGSADMAHRVEFAARDLEISIRRRTQ